MRFVLIPDKFKGSLSAAGVISALSSGIKQVYPGAGISSVIASDGGDGFLHAVAQATRVDEEVCPSVDPLGRPKQARYLLSREDRTAYIELAECSGLLLLDPGERDPALTTTLGTGMQVRDALDKGARTIYIGLGGSATNDGGVGIAHALGFRFRDENGEVLDPIGGNLGHIRSVDRTDVISGLANAEVIAINDVQNPLLGPEGAAAVYAAQKGANPEQIPSLEEGLRNLDHILYGTSGNSAADLPGAGAAGGSAYGLHTFLQAKFVKGVEFMLGLTRADSLFEGRNTDLLITGEGAIDEQTLQGKLIHGVVALGKKYNVPVVAVCGKLDLDSEKVKQYGLEAILEIRDKSKPVTYSMDHAAELVEQTIRDFLKQRKAGN